MKKHHDVTLYTTPGSIYCDLAKSFFKDENINYVELDISKDTNALDSLLRKTNNQKTVPVVDIDGNVIIGYFPQLYAAALK